MYPHVDTRIVGGLDVLLRELERSPVAFWRCIHVAACDLYDNVDQYRPEGWGGPAQDLWPLQAARRDELHSLIAYCERRMHAAGGFRAATGAADGRTSD